MVFALAPWQMLALTRHLFLLPFDRVLENIREIVATNDLVKVKVKPQDAAMD